MEKKNTPTSKLHGKKKKSAIRKRGLRANWNTSRRAEAWHDQMIRDQKTKKNLKIFSKKPNQTIQPWAHSHMARK